MYEAKVKMSFKRIDDLHTILSAIIANANYDGSVLNKKLSVLDIVELITLDASINNVLHNTVYPKRDQILLKYCVKDDSGNPIFDENNNYVFQTPEDADNANKEIETDISTEETMVLFTPVSKNIWSKIENITGGAVQILLPIIIL